MTLHTIPVPIRYLAALKLFIDPHDVRPAVRGILVEVTPDAIYMMATNGKILGVYHLKTETSYAQGSFMIPVELLDHVRSSKKHQNTPVFIEYTPVPENPKNTHHAHIYTVTVSLEADARSGQSIDARPLDWRKVFPKNIYGKTAQFDANYIAQLAAIWDTLHPRSKKTLSTGTVGIVHNNHTQASLLDFDDENFTGLLMPYRMRRNLPTQSPNWIHPVKTSEQIHDAKTEYPTEIQLATTIAEPILQLNASTTLKAKRLHALATLIGYSNKYFNRYEITSFLHRIAETLDTPQAETDKKKNPTMSRFFPTHSAGC